MGVPPAEGAARGQAHFQRADNALAVVGVDACGVARVLGGQFCVQGGRAFRFQAGCKVGRKGGIHGGMRAMPRSRAWK